MAFNFEKLRVWDKSLDLNDSILAIVKQFPDNEKYVLSDQMRRAADSISLNIAEGSTGQSKPQFSKFLGYSIRSCIEIIACLHLGKRRDIISPEDFESTYLETETLVKMLQALRNSLKE